MPKKFNIMGLCKPDEHYIVNIQDKLACIKKMVDNGEYFVINRSRQCGKTTTLFALEEYLNPDYLILHLDFRAISNFEFENAFVSAFSRELLNQCSDISQSISKQLKIFEKSEKGKYFLSDLFGVLCELCEKSFKPVVLMVDEVDSASNYQPFLDFLGKLRYYYQNRYELPTFKSVIFAGVHDICNLSSRDKNRISIPWNIASNFDVEMNFSLNGIVGMLTEYESDYHTGMNIDEMSQLIYDYTSGYPVLVSLFCKLMDERIAGTENFPTKSDAWTKTGFFEAEKILLAEETPLSCSIFDTLKENEKLREVLHRMLLHDLIIPYDVYNSVMYPAIMYGFVTNKEGLFAISNRIFEAQIYKELME